MMVTWNPNQQNHGIKVLFVDLWHIHESNETKKQTEWGLTQSIITRQQMVVTKHNGGACAIIETTKVG